MAQNMDRKLDVVLNQLRINNYEIKTVYDIGANDGRWKYAHSNLFPPHSHFCMFEANPQIQLPNTENQTFFNAASAPQPFFAAIVTLVSPECLGHNFFILVSYFDG